MASLSNSPRGHRTIQFVAADGKRRSIRLGKMPKKLATQIKTRVEILNAANIAGQQPDEETSRWLASLDSSLRDKLVAAGLVAPRAAATLGEFCDAYIAGRTDVKPQTVAECYRPARANLAEFFGDQAELRSITPGQCDEFYIGLKDQYAQATASRRLKTARQFFNAAVRKGLLDSNPFADLKPASQSNRSRDYFVTRDEITKILDVIPGPEWRAIVALVRYGGLRCPSEIMPLRWTDIDWAGERFHVTSPKTEHHEGKESRVVPLFPELRPYLDELWEAPGNAEFVINRYRDATKNLRTQMTRWIKQAGLTPWPRVFQNMRASRETELAAEFPIHVVTAWIGNSVSVATKHYLQVRESDFEKAAQKALHNPVQQVAETGGNGPQRVPQEISKPLENQCFQGFAETASWPPRIRTLTN